MQHTDKIPILEIEAIQLIARLLCVHDILVDHESRAFCVVRYTLSYLPVPKIKSTLSKGLRRRSRVHTGRAQTCRIAQKVPQK